MKTTLCTTFLAICLLTGCQRDTQKTVAVIPKGQAHLFWQSVHAGAEKAARENKAKVIWNGPATEIDTPGQLKIVESMISRRVDAIALAPIDEKGLAGVVERATREKIPVIIFDSGVATDQYVSMVASDNYQVGVMAASRMGALLNGKGNVAIVAVQVGGASTMAREKGFEDTVRERFPNIRIVDKQYGLAEVAKSLSVAENFLTAHPDLDGLFASNESSTMGAAQAVKTRRSQVKLVGVDWSPKLREDLQSGIIDSLVVQDPFRMGYEAVQAAARTWAGQPVAKQNALAPRLIRKEDLGKPDVEAQLNPDLKQYLN